MPNLAASPPPTSVRIGKCIGVEKSAAAAPFAVALLEFITTRFPNLQIALLCRSIDVSQHVVVGLMKL